MLQRFNTLLFSQLRDLRVFAASLFLKPTGVASPRDGVLCRQRKLLESTVTYGSCELTTRFISAGKVRSVWLAGR